MVSVNLEAKKIVDRMIEKADDLKIRVDKLENGSTVIDCGVNVDGSIKQVNSTQVSAWEDLQMLGSPYPATFQRGSHFHPLR